MADCNRPIGEMKRRKFLGTLAVGVTLLAGCTQQEIENIREKATSPDYDTLYRNINDYEGEPVTYQGRIVDFAESSESRQEIVLNAGGSISDPWTFWCIWRGDPFRERDEVRFWGVVDGLETYSSLMGERTVPRIIVQEMELVE